MRRSTSSGNQAASRSEMKRLRELEQENGLLKLLYTDLLQKFSALKDGLIRSEGVC
jgi:hypothetical protein